MKHNLALTSLVLALFLSPFLYAEYDAESAAISGYGYGYQEIQASEQSNLFLGASEGERGVAAYPLDRNTFLNEVPETTPRSAENLFGTYESSVNSFLDEKVSPQDDPSRVLQQYQNLQSEFWDNRGAVRMRPGKTR